MGDKFLSKQAIDLKCMLSSIDGSRGRRYAAHMHRTRDMLLCKSCKAISCNIYYMWRGVWFLYVYSGVCFSL